LKLRPELRGGLSYPSQCARLERRALIQKSPVTISLPLLAVADAPAALIVPFLASALVIGAAGVGKLASPQLTGVALSAAGIRRGSPLIARTLGIYECALCIGCLAVIRSPLAPAVLAATYGAFAVFVVVLRRRGQTEISCGCFGGASVRVSSQHAVTNVVVALAAAATALAGGVDARSLITSSVDAAVLLVATGLGAWLLFALLAVAPEVGSRRRVLADGADCDCGGPAVTGAPEAPQLGIVRAGAQKAVGQ
jgi:hypothetical protein